ncbi:hypothetical protein AUR64_01600 [Haloprofundus marisrubri]|uniref:N-acetyltransferase domain-containing protein n=1 Tax=Haloprofundus marisrubri TaxID=1514971 RepID=A0A0W1R3R8_9EURY|nr:GNAT family N-acetyltransferase [Haloprofundus marisrubri]KTG07956.1 hypothetical protein AUR64_01600 [Haloprofundus marisrubri]
MLFLSELGVMTVSTNERRNGEARPDSGSTADTTGDDPQSSDIAPSSEGSAPAPAPDGGDPTDAASAAVDSTDTSTPVFRPYDSTDRDAVHSLYEAATGDPMDSAWFDRLFVDNPFTSDGVPIHVAEDGDELVGAHLSTAVRVRVGTDVVTALHAIDCVVHPDCEETDLSEQLSTAAEERYADSSAAFAFDFLGGDALGDVLDSGFRVVGEVPTYYRIQNPAALAAQRGPVAGTLGRLGGVVTRGYLGAKRRRAAVDHDVTVSRVDGVPAERLGALAERVDTEAARVVRDAEFYGWRFDDDETYRTYVAARDGEPVAAVVVADRTEEQGRVSLVDVLPADTSSSSSAEVDDSTLSGDSTLSSDDAALRTLLVAVAEQHADANLLTAFGTAFPEAAMRAAGFVRDSDYPLSVLTSPAALVAYPYVDGDAGNADSWRCGGEMLTDGTVWSTTMADHLF